MKIWVIGRNYPEPSNNMKGSFELEQAKMLQKNGEEVCYLCCLLHPKKVIKERGFQSWVEDGISVYTYSHFFPPRIYPFYFSKLRNYLWINFFEQVYKEKGCPDVIHVHYPAMLMIADALLKFHQMGTKIVLTEHWTKVLSKSLDHYEIRAYKKYFTYIDTCICVGKPLANAVKETIGDSKIPICVVPNVVDQDFQPSTIMHSGFEFIAVGRLTKVKQFDQIIKVFTDCFRGKQVTLTIVGDGEEYTSLKKLIYDISMQKQITLTGSLSRHQVAKKIANADCLVCYSRFETFGVPIIEAWACGIPAIATTAASVIDNFDSRLGREVHYDNISDLREKMQYIYKNIAFFDKEYISKFAQENFSESTIYRYLKKIYIEK